jgi:uncharacterized protein YjbJ (UPF0337 family)
MADEPARQARQGLLTSLKGKVKEVAGAVSGNDTLTTEGQLEQQEAATRKEAAAEEAVAEAEGNEAAEELAQQQELAASERRAAVVETTAETVRARSQADAEKHRADARADHDRQVGEDLAEIKAAERQSDARYDAAAEIEAAKDAEEAARQQHERSLASVETVGIPSGTSGSTAGGLDDQAGLA